MTQSLLYPWEPPAVVCERESGSSPFVFLCDHSGPRIPARLNDLDISHDDLKRHIAWDIGIDSVGRELSSYFDACLIMQPYSRLVIDCNRRPGSETSILAESDGTKIPGNHGAWQDVYPDAGYTPFRGTKGTVREGGNRVPSIAWGPRIKGGSKNSEIVGGLDYMATFASLAGVKLPENDRAGQPIIFDSYDLSPVLFGTGKSPRKEWFYFTENELSPGAARSGNYKAVFNLRGDDGAKTGGLAVDSNLGWKGAESYVATVPQVFDLWQDPQERYDIFMNNYTERTWVMITISDAINKLMATYVKYPPRKLQSESYSGPITLTNYQRFQYLREQLAKDGFKLDLPTGN
jgi:N-formylglutamate amidohydrolase/C-terminal region of aryl-sulfatase